MNTELRKLAKDDFEKDSSDIWDLLAQLGLG